MLLSFGDDVLSKLLSFISHRRVLSRLIPLSLEASTRFPRLISSISIVSAKKSWRIACSATQCFPQLSTLALADVSIVPTVMGSLDCFSSSWRNIRHATLKLRHYPASDILSILAHMPAIDVFAVASGGTWKFSPVPTSVPSEPLALEGDLPVQARKFGDIITVLPPTTEIRCFKLTNGATTLTELGIQLPTAFPGPLSQSQVELLAEPSVLSFELLRHPQVANLAPCNATELRLCQPKSEFPADFVRFAFPRVARLEIHLWPADPNYAEFELQSFAALPKLRTVTALEAQMNQTARFLVRTPSVRTFRLSRSRPTSGHGEVPHLCLPAPPATRLRVLDLDLPASLRRMPNLPVNLVALTVRSSIKFDVVRQSMVKQPAVWRRLFRLRLILEIAAKDGLSAWELLRTRCRSVQELKVATAGSTLRDGLPAASTLSEPSRFPNVTQIWINGWQLDASAVKRIVRARPTVSGLGITLTRPAELLKLVEGLTKIKPRRLMTLAIDVLNCGSILSHEAHFLSQIRFILMPIVPHLAHVFVKFIDRS